jgi:hypothetical protein
MTTTHTVPVTAALVPADATRRGAVAGQLHPAPVPRRKACGLTFVCACGLSFPSVWELLEHRERCRLRRERKEGR